MAFSKPIAALLHEHEIILKAVTGLQHMAAALTRREPLAAGELREAVEFMRIFADRCHHAKEEDLLFPALVQAGLPATSGPVAVMKAEHAQARTCVGEFAAAIDAYEAGEAGSRERIVAAIGCIGSLYPQHIGKENNVLFPMAERILPPDRLADLGLLFDAVEGAHGADVHRRWVAVAQRLACHDGAAAPAAAG